MEEKQPKLNENKPNQVSWYYGAPLLAGRNLSHWFKSRTWLHFNYFWHYSVFINKKEKE